MVKSKSSVKSRSKAGRRVYDKLKKSNIIEDNDYKYVDDGVSVIFNDDSLIIDRDDSTSKIMKDGDEKWQENIVVTPKFKIKDKQLVSKYIPVSKVVINAAADGSIQIRELSNKNKELAKLTILQKRKPLDEMNQGELRAFVDEMGLEQELDVNKNVALKPKLLKAIKKALKKREEKRSKNYLPTDLGYHAYKTDLVEFQWFVSPNEKPVLIGIEDYEGDEIDLHAYTKEEIIQILNLDADENDFEIGFV